ncbi:hypothetical protein [Haliangium ochraceum]|nr:hypothetical protein [Haliangium ochraceum]
MRSALAAALLGAALGTSLGGGDAHAQQNQQTPDDIADDTDKPDDAETRVIDIRVVEVAGGRAYIQPGEGAGVRLGQNVRIGGRRYRVVAVESDYAVIDLGDRTLREGDRGRTRVSIRAMTGSPLPPTVPLSDFEGQWRPATPPALAENPERVPLGPTGAGGNYRLVVFGGAAAFVPLVDEAEPVVYGTLGGRMHAEPWRELPLSFDADVAVSLWLGQGLDSDIGADSRPLINVRELAAYYGDDTTPIGVGLGRLRYAASTLGLLDGVRLSSPSFGNVRVSAFGGVVPNPLDGSLDFDHRRFGVEATYYAPKASWQPMLSVVAHGSMFDGQLDERRVSATASSFFGPVAASAYGEVSMFDEDNPWRNEQIELTAAGVDASVRFGKARLGARLDTRMPERSYWLASLLPGAWLCTPWPDSPDVDEACNGSRDARHSAALDAQYDLGRLLLSAGGTVVSLSSDDTIEAVTGFADARLLEIFDRYRTELGVYAAHTDFLDTAAVRAGFGGPMPLVDALDFSLYYRPAILRYSAAIDDKLDHRVGLDTLYTASPRLDVAFTVEAAAGDDILALAAFATAVWRPQL